MAYFQRIAIILLLALPSFLPGTALADYNKTFTRYLLNNWAYYNSDLQTVCNTFMNAKKSAYPTETILMNTCTEAQVTLKNQYNQVSYSNAISKYGSCNGVESLWGNGICTGSCPAPSVLNGSNQCVPPVTCSGNQVIDTATNTCKCNPGCNGVCGQNFKIGGTSDGYPSSGCNGGCTYKHGDGIQSSADQSSWIIVYGNNTGQVCTTPTPPPSSTPSSPEYDCAKQGKSYGTVNGVTVCVAAGTPGSAKTQTAPPTTTSSGTTTSKDAAGNTTGTASTSDNTSKVVSFNGDGTVKTTSTTNTTNADGTTSAKDEVKTQTVADYCKDNPNVAQCKAADKSSYGEACAGGVSTATCEGDAVQCAIAKQAADANCKFFKPDTEMESAFTGMKSNDVTTSSNLIPRSTVNIVSSLDSSSTISATCPPDKVIQVMTSEVVFPISQLCGTLEAIGYIFLALAYVAAARIIGGAV